LTKYIGRCYTRALIRTTPFVSNLGNQFISMNDLRDIKNRNAQTRYLLLDNRIVDKTENVRLINGKVKKHPANPLLVADKPWEIAFGNMYPSIIHDEGNEVYKCWYNLWVIDKAHESTPPDQRHTKLYKPTLQSLTKPGEHSRVNGRHYWK